MVKRRNLFIPLFLLLLLSTLGGEEAPEDEKAVRRYLELQRRYTLWEEGLFGSRKAHERELRQFLLRECLGKKIRTAADYRLASPESITDPALVSPFPWSDWLRIKGPMDRQQILDVLGGDLTLLVTWWRTRRLVAVSGVVRKYRLVTDARGPAVEIVLESVTLHGK
jgi:hypothetical protein